MMSKVSKTENGSYKISRFEIFPWVGFWGLGSFNIGHTKILQCGFARIFIEGKCPHE